MTDTNKETTKSNKAIYLIPFIWIIIIVIAGYFYKNSYGEIIRNISMTVLSFILMHYSLLKDINMSKLIFPDHYNGARLVIICSFCMIAAVLFPILPITGWFYPAIFVLIAFESSVLSGIIGSSCILFVSVMLSGAKSGVFILYFFTGIIAILLINDAIKNDKNKVFIIINAIFDLLAMAVMIVFYQTTVINVEAFIVPSINIVIISVILIIIINIYSSSVYDSRITSYLKINDQTCIILKELKEKDNSTYLKNIHTSHFASCIGEALEADMLLCKGGGYYYNVKGFTIDGIMNDKDNTYEYLSDNSFPSDLIEMLKSLENVNISNIKDVRFINREQAAICLSRFIVEYIYKNKETINNKSFETMINELFDNVYINHCMENTSISFEGFKKAREMALGQKNYIRIM